MKNLTDEWIAYFSMEIGIDNRIPTFCGGLGVLAGDTISSAADLRIPLIAFTLLYRKGYFEQRFDPSGWQQEVPVRWRIEDYLQPVDPIVAVELDGRTVRVRAWRFDVRGVTGHVVPIFFLDTDVHGNAEWDRTVTDQLYGGDWYYRLCQEVVLGIGGIRMARALGFERIRRFHMNEGHAALLTLELLAEAAERAGRERVNGEDIQEVRRHCIFTTHTPVAAGHDRFRLSGIENVVHPLSERFDLTDPACLDLLSRAVEKDGKPISSPDKLFKGDPWFNMTRLALDLSRYVNGVAKKHGEVSRHMFPGYEIDAITNGVHAGRWTAPPFQHLYDRYLPGWKEDNFALRHAAGIPKAELWDAHVKCKTRLIDYVNETTNSNMEVEPLTLGFARRAAVYKRPDLLFTDIERLRQISRRGRIQLIYSGKAHPLNTEGKEMIRRIFEAFEALRGDISAAYLDDYDMELGAMLTSGVDVWLNNPEPPMEASGTSGMKAALNGVPSFSVLDGWWVEGHVEGVTGWSIGDGEDRSRDAPSLYDKLEQVILPLFYQDRDQFLNIVCQVIALNGSFFTSHRMLYEYVVDAYL